MRDVFQEKGAYLRPDSQQEEEETSYEMSYLRRTKLFESQIF